LAEVIVPDVDVANRRKKPPGHSLRSLQAHSITIDGADDGVRHATPLAGP
jgi:hypothetical protein